MRERERERGRRRSPLGVAPRVASRARRAGTAGGAVRGRPVSRLAKEKGSEVMVEVVLMVIKWMMMLKLIMMLMVER